jgi:hypothetical protein
LRSRGYRAVVEAIARRDHLRLLVDGITAANDLGLTDAVPARVTIHTDARRRAIQLDQLNIEFKHTAHSTQPPLLGRAPSHALYWLKDTLSSDTTASWADSPRCSDPTHGSAIGRDLLDGFSVLPAWMQSLVRELPGCDPQAAWNDSPKALELIRL